MTAIKPARRTVSFPALAAMVAAAAVGISAPAAAAAPSAQVREVCAKSVYVKKQPGVFIVGSVTKGQRVKVTRYSQSGRFARIVARTPGYTVRGWMPTRYLCAAGRSA